MQLELFDTSGIFARVFQPVNGYLSEFSFLGPVSETPFIAFRLTPLATFLPSSEYSIAGPCPVEPGVIPGPASWAMLITGFGLIGGALRRPRAGQKASRPVAIS
ncbi:MAG: PEPxxWA-CTERM sorting domain-containing protein [Sphingomonadaceae bacterium]